MKLNLNIPLSSLTNKELKILQYIHDNENRISKMSIQTFAKEINYSTSTVLRFCRKLGFSGFPELKFFLRHQEQEPSKKNSNYSIESIKKSIITDLEGTTSLMNTDDLLQIAKLLSSNIPIYIHLPAGLTDISVNYLESMLFISGCQNIYKSHASKMTHHYIQTLDKGNIFIFISNSGKFETTLNLAKEAKLHGMIVISISSIENNDLAEISNYNIRFFSKKTENEGADSTSRFCTFFVLSTFIEFFNEYKKGIDHEIIS